MACPRARAAHLAAGYVVIKGFPCRVSDYSTAKTGKHGAAKAMYVGVDIFTGRKYEDSKPTSATTLEPNGEWGGGRVASVRWRRSLPRSSLPRRSQ